MASRHKKRRPGEQRDTMIAGIVLSHRATLATGNAAHFDDLSVPLINPISINHSRNQLDPLLQY
jgi:predicted nucleic acid-binding protein